ncbi:MAG TPA: hypothetical protein VEJ45_06150 [Candidatus Acidoferrales bacterium]|nr:hypothetical protein [Candidatus Acidoferrales bacterium]
MTEKTPDTTLQAPVAMIQQDAGGPSPQDLAARWKEARLAYPLYEALATEFHLASPPYSPGELPPARPTRSTFDRDTKWLDALDEKIMAFQLRQLPSEILNGNKESLRALIRRQLRRPEKTHIDRDKIDLLLVQYFALCTSEEEDLIHKDIRLADVARLLEPVLAEADPTPPAWCAPLEEILDKTKHCHSLRDLMEDGLVEQGRMLKDSAGPMFYDPAALVAFCRFNFLLRLAFIRMLHADLKAVAEAIEKLETLGVKTVDCRGAGFSAAETTAQLRFFGENWRQPFQKDYTQSSVHRAFEQLLAVRTALEEALARKSASSQPVLEVAEKTVVAAGSPLVTTAPRQGAPKLGPDQAVQKAPTPLAASTHEPAEPASPAAGTDTSAADPETCMEAIWEQLIAAPPSRGRSMSTVVLQDTKVLLSSWEVAAFVSEGDQDAEDLRRAVVARALLAMATDRRKRSGDESALRSALTFARTEVSYYQGRVEQSKKAKRTEAAVNLGISTKRLLSFIEEAEGLQS